MPDPSIDQDSKKRSEIIASELVNVMGLIIGTVACLSAVPESVEAATMP